MFRKYQLKSEKVPRNFYKDILDILNEFKIIIEFFGNLKEILGKFSEKFMKIARRILRKV